MRPTTVAFLLGAFVWVPLGACLMGALASGAREDAEREAYRRGVQMGRLSMWPRMTTRFYDDEGHELAQRAEASVHGAER